MRDERHSPTARQLKQNLSSAGATHPLVDLLQVVAVLAVHSLRLGVPHRSGLVREIKTTSDPRDPSPASKRPPPAIIRGAFRDRNQAGASYDDHYAPQNIGLQLYTVGHEMDSDPAGTLKAVAAAGYKQVELSPLSKTPPKDLKKMLEDVGLKNPSGHYMLPDLMSKLPEMIDVAQVFGQEFMVVTVPWVAESVPV